MWNLIEQKLTVTIQALNYETKLVTLKKPMFSLFDVILFFDLMG